MSSQVDDRTRFEGSETHSRNLDLGQKLLAGGGVLGALAASSCCLVPLALFGLGIGGAWIGHLTRLAPYQPYLLAVAAIGVGFGLWARHRSRKVACSQSEACARPLPGRVVMTGFILAGVLIAATLALDLLAPMFF
jgi:mercuric ion transport protein